MLLVLFSCYKCTHFTVASVMRLARVYYNYFFISSEKSCVYSKRRFEKASTYFFLFFHLYFFYSHVVVCLCAGHRCTNFTLASFMAHSGIQLYFHSFQKDSRVSKKGIQKPSIYFFFISSSTSFFVLHCLFCSRVRSAHILQQVLLYGSFRYVVMFSYLLKSFLVQQNKVRESFYKLLSLLPSLFLDCARCCLFARVS